MEKHTFSIWSPQLRNHRGVDVYLPDSYDAGGRRRYPIVYMHDGQNLSDPATAFGGTTWDLYGALAHLAHRGLEPIIVGIHNTGESRLSEYSPFPDSRHGGGAGDRYAHFVADVLKPRIDAQYRVTRDRNGTVVLGSSMGGLISAYEFFMRPSPFGRAGIMSPSIWFGERRIVEFAEAARFTRGRVYLDVGTEEGNDTLRDARAFARVLRAKGYGRGMLRYVEAQGHRHQESDWARRLPAALEFLLR